MTQTEQSTAYYKLIETQKNMDGRPYRCYGIRLCFAGATVDVEDLSLNRQEVEELTEKCNRLSLSPLHFQDVLEDFMER